VRLKSPQNSMSLPPLIVRNQSTQRRTPPLQERQSFRTDHGPVGQETPPPTQLSALPQQGEPHTKHRLPRNQMPAFQQSRNPPLVARGVGSGAGCRLGVCRRIAVHPPSRILTIFEALSQIPLRTPAPRHGKLTQATTPAHTAPYPAPLTD